MAARAERLGDRGPSAPAHWEAGLGTGEAHVLVTLYGVDEERLEQARDALRGVGAAGAIKIVHEQRAAALDQASRPLRLRRRDRAAGDRGQRRGAAAGRRPAGRPRRLAAGADRRVPARLRGRGRAAARRAGRAASTATARSPSTASCTWTSPRSGASSRTTDFPGGPELLAAKLVGRRPDGTPLVRSPAAPGARADPRAINDFSYARDPDGLRCPLGAHIRRANPRDAPRLLRRPALQPPPPDPPRPLLRPAAPARRHRGRRRRPRPVFVCFNASIWRQFETVQALWIDDGDPFGLGPDKDFLVGEPHGTQGKMTIQGHPPFFLKPQPRFVTHARRRVPVPAEHDRPALPGRLALDARSGGVTLAACPGPFPRGWASHRPASSTPRSPRPSASPCVSAWLANPDDDHGALAGTAVRGRGQRAAAGPPALAVRRAGRGRQRVAIASPDEPSLSLPLLVLVFHGRVPCARGRATAAAAALAVGAYTIAQGTGDLASVVLYCALVAALGLYAGSRRTTHGGAAASTPSGSTASARCSPTGRSPRSACASPGSSTTSSRTTSA